MDEEDNCNNKEAMLMKQLGGLMVFDDNDNTNTNTNNNTNTNTNTNSHTNVIASENNVYVSDEDHETPSLLVSSIPRLTTPKTSRSPSLVYSSSSSPPQFDSPPS